MSRLAPIGSDADDQRILDAASGIGFVVTDDRDRVTRWSLGAENLLGFRAEQALGKPFSTWLGCGGCDNGRVETWLKRADGGRIWVQVDANPLPDGRGRVRVIVDRTPERQAAESARSDRDRLWQISTDLMLVARFDGTILAVNPAWTHVLGWPEAELPGVCLLDLVHPDEVAATRAALAELEAGQSWRGVNRRHRHRDGGYRWICWTAVPGGGVINAVGRDFTAEKEQAEALEQSEQRLRQAQKMEAVGQLTSGLAHDFNNLLTGIMGSLELLQMRLEKGRTDGLDNYIATALGAAGRAAALTHRLLAFSRRQTLAPARTEANELIAGMEELIRRTIGPSITLEAVLAEALWPIFCDPNQLENALLNLCINARDAMPDGGRLEIRTANAALAGRRANERGVAAGDYVAISVTDTGTGMTPDVLSRAFDPFFTTKPLGQGTGLGLSMIYGFVRQSGGHVQIESEVGRGTSVVLYLPRYLGGEEAERDTAGPAGVPRAAEGQTVLVVDDEPTVRRLVIEALRNLGYDTIEAEDGASGLAVLLSAARIDLLVTDVGLPGGMNGRQLADAAKDMRPDVKVLFITGYAENALVANGQLEPGMHVLVKPFTIETLAGRVKEIIGL